jgi:pimeloyl-ACP methyl ester carboxylesterase
MITDIEARELITLNANGTLLRGTYHKPHDQAPFLQPAARDQSRLGILFLNSLSLPRAATGDSAIFWAESFAEAGYPSFRIDLPGLGDSDGDAPPDFLRFINTGGYALSVSAGVKELVARFNLSGMVIVGHCAGAVSAVYAASLTDECRGLVLMDPYFHLPRAVRPKVRQGLTEWASRNPLGGRLSDAFDRLKHFRLYLRGNAPPANANFNLLNRWRKLTSTGLPILVLRAPGVKTAGAKPRLGEFDYFSYVQELAGKKNQVLFRFIDGTNHSFADRAGRIAVQQTTHCWLNAYLPLTSRTSAARGRHALEGRVIT